MAQRLESIDRKRRARDTAGSGRSRGTSSSIRAGVSAFVLAFGGLASSTVGLLGCAGARPDPPELATEVAGLDARDTIQLGPRPFYLIERMSEGPLRTRLEACAQGPFRATRFSIGHRGAPLQFPEHTRESYLAAARMGAGTLECDVAFTRDDEMVCRHAQCDLATTTDILETPLAERCREPFRPARFEAGSGELVEPASARCCTSDLSLAEIRRLEARMDSANPRAQDVSAYRDATPSWRTDLYTNGSALMTHGESLALFRSLGVAMTPELKAFEADPGQDGEGDRMRSERKEAARRLLDAYRDAGIPPEDVRLQSFEADNVRTWLALAPDYGAQAVWLVDRAPTPLPTRAELAALRREGFRTIGASIGLLLRLDEAGRLRASEYAKRARAAGFELLAWTLERSGRIRAGRVEGRDRDFYLDPVLSGLTDDGDVYRVLHALVEEIGVRGVFSDWPATTTYYANCFGLD